MDLLGDDDISEIGDGTVTSAITDLNNDLKEYTVLKSDTNILPSNLTSYYNLINKDKAEKYTLVVEYSGVKEFFKIQRTISSGVYFACTFTSSVQPVLNTIYISSTSSSFDIWSNGISHYANTLTSITLLYKE